VPFFYPARTEIYRASPVRFDQRIHGFQFARDGIHGLSSSSSSSLVLLLCVEGISVGEGRGNDRRVSATTSF